MVHTCKCVLFGCAFVPKTINCMNVYERIILAYDVFF